VSEAAVVYTADERELLAKLEAGHKVMWSEFDPKQRRILWFICQKRGVEYVTVIGTSEKGAEKNWTLAHARGYYRDDHGRRVSIPGAR
jgi:hypothetical protein